MKTRSPRAARSKQLITVDDMTGGLDLRRSQTLMRPNRSRVALNVSLEEPGALMMRPGHTRVSSAAIFSGRAQGGQRVYLASTVFTLLAGGGAIYKPDDSWVSAGAVYSTLSSVNQIYFPYDRDRVMAMDGSNRPRMSSNGSSWVLSGIDAPSSAATVSTLSSGTISSGEFAFSYAYKHRASGHISNGATESTGYLAGTTGAFHLTASPSTDPKVDAYVWYGRHKTPDGESVLRKISSGADSTIRIISSAWTSNDELHINHNVPPTGLRFGVSWKNRWWAPSGTVGNRLHFTELFLPQAWPSLFFIDIPFENGDGITAVMPHGDTLLVFGQSGIFLVIGQTSLDFEVRPSQGADIGAFGPRSAVRTEQSVMHAANNSIATFDGASDASLSHDIAPSHRDLVQNTPSTSLALVAMVHDDIRHEVRISAPRVTPTSTRGELILYLDRTREQNGVPAWTTTDRDIHLYIPWDGNEPTAGNVGRLFSLPSTSGFVYEENVGASANSSNMTMNYEGAGISLGLHRARAVDAHVEFEPHTGSFSIEAQVDGASMGAIAINTGAGVFTYGSASATYGSATFSGVGRKKAYTPLPIQANGRTIVTKLSYTGQERMKVYGYAYGIVPESIPRQHQE